MRRGTQVKHKQTRSHTQCQGFRRYVCVCMLEVLARDPHHKQFLQEVRFGFSGGGGSQRLQYPLIEEYTSNHIRGPTIFLRDIPELRDIGVSGFFGARGF